jgi:hypothetical protein
MCNGEYGADRRQNQRTPRGERLVCHSVRRFLLKALRDLKAGKQPPGLVYDSGKADFSRIRCDVAYLSSNVSWRTLFEDKSGETEKA